MQEVSRRIGFVVIRRCEPVSMLARSAYPPKSCRLSKELVSRVILPFGLLLLGVPSPRTPLEVFRPELTYPGFWPSSRRHQLASTHRGGTQRPASFRPQALSTSRRFSPQAGLQVCFALQPCPGPIPVQGLLSQRSSASFQKSLPPCRYRRRAHRSPDVHAIDASASRPWLRAEQRFVRRGLTLDVVRSPLQVFMLLQAQILRRRRRLPSVVHS